MFPRVTLLNVCMLLACGPFIRAQAPVELPGGKTRLRIDPATGALAVCQHAGDPLLQSGERGLWRIRFDDGSTLDAASVQPEQFKLDRVDQATLRLTYDMPQATVVITAKANNDAVELLGTLTPRDKVALDFELPARLRFAPADLTRFVSPLNPHMGLGAAFKSGFFKPQDAARPSSWTPQPHGNKGWVALAGAGLEMRNLDGAAVGLSVTEEGKKWFPAEVAARLTQSRARVNRPCPRNQAKLVLLDSADGPYFTAGDLQGKGLLWRIGGSVSQGESAAVLDAICAVIDKLASASPAKMKIALLRLTNGPSHGGMVSIAVTEWRDRLSKIAARRSLEFVELSTPAAMLQSARAGECLVILNPYGEWLPVDRDASLLDSVAAIKQFVRDGGNWFEIGGYAFYAALRPSLYLKYESPYPPAFADFQHLDTRAGSVSVYRVAPRAWEPWQGERDKRALFIPGRIGCGGDERGGYADRSFATFVKPGETWQAPLVRLVAGNTADEDLCAYARTNGITRRLEEKLPPATCDTLRRAVLVKYDGNCEQKLAHLDKLPVPSLIHFSEYLKGGFDKEYPDHLPPNAAFGTPAQFRQFLDAARAKGHLTMPYTNPTWWCDHPRGPTFEKEGEAPLLRGLDGKPIHEKYDVNDGWTTTFWHPAVRRANDALLAQFSRDFPVDILFQDQCGARTWHYDTNTASPAPYAYHEGLLSMVDQQSRTLPLSTEDAFDQVINAQVQVCGMTFALVPGRAPEWVRMMRHQFHPSLWEIYPVAQVIAHDKVIFLHHDLGKFVTNRQALAWTLALGFSMSERLPAAALNEPRRLQWLLWLDRVQKSICARYIGQPVRDFAHDRGSTDPADTDDGAIRASYGDVRIVANLGPAPRKIIDPKAGEFHLAANGFLALVDGALIAGNLQGLAGLDFGDEGLMFIAQRNAGAIDLWFFAEGGREAAALLPVDRPATMNLRMEGQADRAVEVKPGTPLRLTLPAIEGAKLPRLHHLRLVER